MKSENINISAKKIRKISVAVVDTIMKELGHNDRTAVDLNSIALIHSIVSKVLAANLATLYVSAVPRDIDVIRQLCDATKTLTLDMCMEVE